MKARNGFVSNSSSSSFVVHKEYISEYQMERIYAHVEEVDRDYDVWSIEDLGHKVRFSTSMDNFDMESYLERIGVPTKEIKYEW